MNSVPTLRQFEAARMVHQVKDPKNILTKLDYATFVALWKEVGNRKRHYSYVCAKNPDHKVFVVRRGYVVEDALTGEEVDGDMEHEGLDCETCRSNGETVIDDYHLEDFMDV